jgi:hypothetical protein
MRRTVTIGAFTLALTMGACAVKQPRHRHRSTWSLKPNPNRKRCRLRQPLSRSLQRNRPGFSRRSMSTRRPAIGRFTEHRGYTLYPYNQGPQPAVDC